jgi:hypothetical protein
MRKLIIAYFLVFFVMVSADFTDIICNVTRQSINKLPEIANKLINVLGSKSFLALCSVSTLYCTYQNKRSIPFLRSFTKIREIKNKEELLLNHNKYLLKKATCLCGLLVKTCKECAVGEKGLDAIKKIGEKLKGFDTTDDLYAYLNPLDEEAMELNQGLNDNLKKRKEEELRYENEEEARCVIATLFKELQKEPIDYTKFANIKIILNSWLKRTPYILELLLLPSLYFLCFKTGAKIEGS